MSDLSFNPFPTLAAQLYEFSGPLNKQELIVFGARPGHCGEQLFYEHMMANRYYNKLHILHFCQSGQSNLSELAAFFESPDGEGKGLRTISRDFITLSELITDVRVLHGVEKIDAIYINHFDMLDTSMKELRKNRISDLKSLAVQLDIAMVVFCRLNKDVDLRGGSRIPFPADMSDRNQLEYVADTVFLSYSPEYYGFLEDEDGNPTNGLLRLYRFQNKKDSVDVKHLKKSITHRAV